jgi:uncharacterized protein YjbI with pentapeptide repeats
MSYLDRRRSSRKLWIFAVNCASVSFAANCYLENMPTIIALILAFILSFPSNAFAAGGTSSYNPTLSYSGAQLAGEDFSGKNLQTAEFTSANLDNTNFSGADLTGSVLSSLILKGTNFHGADLTQGLVDQVRFISTDLSDAVFFQAMMLRSTFKDVNIQGADFTDAILGKVEQNKLCLIADGVNPKTGVKTRDSLGCK